MTWERAGATSGLLGKGMWAIHGHTFTQGQRDCWVYRDGVGEVGRRVCVGRSLWNGRRGRWRGLWDC